METRKDRFRRIVSRRTNEIIEKFRILGNCANKSSYEYTEEDVNKIFRAIEAELRNTKAKFSIRRKKFSL